MVSAGTKKSSRWARALTPDLVLRVRMASSASDRQRTKRVDEERALTLLQKAERNLLSAEESRWLERWLRAEEGNWLQSLIGADDLRRQAPAGLRLRVRRALRSMAVSTSRGAPG